jgi:response regulator RpfG family c-di-GMP phosphodiesterase
MINEIESDNEDEAPGGKKTKMKKRPSLGAMFSIRKEAETPALGLRVLVCEDSISAQKMMAKWLDKNGCVVTLANNGKEGLQFMTSQEFDVCFMDFLMVRMIG